MKKLLYLPLMLVLCLGFVACGDDDKPELPVDPYDVVPFVWRGDWNNPDDPNYKKDGYNPLEGDWQRVSNPNIRYVFTADRQIVLTYTQEGNWKTDPPYPYEINDMTYRYTTGALFYRYQYKFVTEDGMRYLMLRQMTNTDLKPDGDWFKLKAYE